MNCLFTYEIIPDLAIFYMSRLQAQSNISIDVIHPIPNTSFAIFETPSPIPHPVAVHSGTNLQLQDAIVLQIKVPPSQLNDPIVMFYWHSKEIVYEYTLMCTINIWEAVFRDDNSIHFTW